MSDFSVNELRAAYKKHAVQYPSWTKNLPRIYRVTPAFRKWLKSVGYLPPRGTTEIVTNMIAPKRFKFRSNNGR